MEKKYKNVRYTEYDYNRIVEIMDELNGYTPRKLYTNRTMLEALELYLKREKRRVRG